MLHCKLIVCCIFIPFLKQLIHFWQISWNNFFIFYKIISLLHAFVFQLAILKLLKLMLYKRKLNISILSCLLMKYVCNHRSEESTWVLRRWGITVEWKARNRRAWHDDVSRRKRNGCGAGSILNASIIVLFWRAIIISKINPERKAKIMTENYHQANMHYQYHNIFRIYKASVIKSVSYQYRKNLA